MGSASSTELGTNRTQNKNKLSGKNILKTVGVLGGLAALAVVSYFVGEQARGEADSNQLYTNSFKQAYLNGRQDIKSVNLGYWFFTPDSGTATLVLKNGETCTNDYVGNPKTHAVTLPEIADWTCSHVDLLKNNVVTETPPPIQLPILATPAPPTPIPTSRYGGS